MATREAMHTKIEDKKARDAASFFIGTAFPSVKVLLLHFEKRKVEIGHKSGT
jgi:hypothetical protein